MWGGAHSRFRAPAQCFPGDILVTIGEKEIPFEFEVEGDEMRLHLIRKGRVQDKLKKVKPGMLLKGLNGLNMQMLSVEDQRQALADPRRPAIFRLHDEEDVRCVGGVGWRAFWSLLREKGEG